MKLIKETDVLIIGAGIIGMSLARELTRYHTDVTVIEKESDVAMGISKTAGSLIYMGLFQALSLVVKDLGRGADLIQETRTERMRMLWDGFCGFAEIAHQLEIAHKHVGVLIVARDHDEQAMLSRLEELCKYVPGGTVRHVSRDELFEMEPNLTRNALEGLHDSTGTISMFGPEYVIALYENAKVNGATILLGTECLGVRDEREGQVVSTSKGDIKARFVINCAGKYADRVADMAGARSGWNLVFYRSQPLVLDRRLNGFIRNIIGAPPVGGKIDFLYPLLEGNIHVYGGQYDLTNDREFTETTQKDYDEAIRRMKLLCPSLRESDVITSYAGVRTFNDKEFDENLIEHSPRNPDFINVLVRMPGFTPAAKIAEKVVGMMVDRGLSLERDDRFNERRQAIPKFRFLTSEQRNALIEKDHRFGRIVCRCESVTEGEIVEAVKRGARTIQGVMFRTRAGMGRCQRNWCGPKVIQILAREMGVPETEVTFKGPGSEMALN